MNSGPVVFLDYLQDPCDSLDQVNSLAFGENIVSGLRRAKSGIGPR